LASMMANRRRRQTILAIVTSLFLCVVLVPSLLASWNGSDSAEQPAPDAAGPAAESDELEQAVRMDRLESRVRLINAGVPPGWLARGAGRLREREWLSALAAAVGMGLIGALSLMRSYRTTLRLYTGDFAAGGGKSKAAARRSDRPDARVSTARLTLTE